MNVITETMKSILQSLLFLFAIYLFYVVHMKLDCIIETNEKIIERLNER